MSKPISNTGIVKNMARNLGFEFCGIAAAKPLDEDARRLEDWLNKGFHGKMSYMERHFDLRVNPQKLVPGAKSVITLLLNYYPAQQQQPEAPRIAKYAFGKDYHEVIREKLNVFLANLKQELGDIEGRGFVDSAPVLERTWAQRSGLGWIGRNGNLITKEAGSFYFIATLITDLELVPDDPFAKDYCGTCRRCIDACPTDAILEDKVIDGSRCISYFTIELKDALIPEPFKNQLEGWAFGCDTCQDVCPWNRFSKAHTQEALKPIPEILNLSRNEWIEMTEENFRRIFKESPLKRTKWKGMMRNLGGRI
jgi:epoxyqueuosine reductase